MKAVKLSALREQCDEKSTKYVGPKYISRWGIAYSWYNATCLDEGIRTRQRRAIGWRQRLITLLEEAGADRAEFRTIKYRYARACVARKATIYSICGRDVLCVYHGSAPYGNRGWIDLDGGTIRPGDKLHGAEIV